MSKESEKEKDRGNRPGYLKFSGCLFGIQSNADASQATRRKQLSALTLTTFTMKSCPLAPKMSEPPTKD